MAVLLVMFLHLRDLERVYRADAVLPGWADIGHSGVDLFFVISGFIMVLIGHAYPATRGAAGRFLYHRWARIYPTYWFWFLLTLAFYLSAPAWLRFEAGQVTHLVESFFLIPTWTPQLVPVSWTLKYELYFYLIFSLVILVPARRRILLLLVWAGYMLIGQQFCYDAPDVLCHKSLFLTMHPLAFEFLFGAVVAGIYLYRRSLHPRFIFILGSCLLVGSFVIYIRSGVNLDDNSWYRVLLFGFPSALLLYGCVELERQQGLRVPAWVVVIGNASYSIYLSHFLLFDLLYGRLATLSVLPAALVAGIVFTLSLGVGLMAYRWVERPLLHLSRGCFGSARYDPAGQKAA
ncbi:peptidoglycan/LPS O-acetylase OafA/YrhL [Thiocapsa rosea]|uniref:Peptidoglycan/LPS O-acetylase OafA/YrhL n=1 Tax=Thiocapsa rosea TaxID=69360 RepID=A0A495V570_9GAMM|nr:peptidoglycan/LPS O-acetylase OafA/YrhL [Thiocapsa rosea]